MGIKLHNAGLLDHLDEPTYRSEPPYDIELWGSGRITKEDIVGLLEKNVQAIQTQIERLSFKADEEAFMEQMLLETQSEALLSLKREIDEQEQRFNAYDQNGNEIQS